MTTPREDGFERRLILEIRARLMSALREEYRRLGRESNPGPPTWDDYLSTVLYIGLERLRSMSDRQRIHHPGFALCCLRQSTVTSADQGERSVLLLRHISGIAEMS
jgi:hypothetical protein